jgi:hypothetical protein
VDEDASDMVGQMAKSASGSGSDQKLLTKPKCVRQPPIFGIITRVGNRLVVSLSALAALTVLLMILSSRHPLGHVAGLLNNCRTRS